MPCSSFISECDAMRGKHNFSAGVVLAAFSLLLTVSSTTPLQAGQLSALGNSVSGGPRPLYLISPANGNITATLNTPFRPPGYGNDLAPLGLAYGGGFYRIIRTSL